MIGACRVILNGVDALLFDLGGVVTDIDFNRVLARWAHSADCDQADLKSRFAADAPYRQHEIGALSDQDYFASLRSSLRIDISDAQFLDGWNDIFVGEMPGMAAVLKRAAKAMPLYAFSNTNPAHVLHWSKRYAAICSHFTEMFLSSTIGMRKPDAAAFDYVIEQIGVPAERIVFFDDVLENVHGGAARGLRAVHVATRSTVAESLAPLLV
jgi:HAD superfamily hydrolase (TIGR01509 family)